MTENAKKILSELLATVPPESLGDCNNEFSQFAPIEETCDLCGRRCVLVTMSPLPEVEQYVLRLRYHFLYHAPLPEFPDDTALIQKYGFDSASFFCNHCYDKLNEIVARRAAGIECECEEGELFV